MSGGPPPSAELVVCASASDVARATASRMLDAIAGARRARGVAVVALSGGSTPLPAYRLLAEQPTELAHVEWFLADERCVPAESDRSNFRAIGAALFGPANIDPARAHAVRTDLPPAAAAADYAATLGRLVDGAPTFEGLDLVVAGVGADGHTASLFPGRGAVARTDALAVAVEPGGELEPRVSLARPVLVAARRVLVVATGAAKRAVVAAARSAGSEDDVPARIFLGCRPGVVTWLVDREAAEDDP